MVVPQRMPTGRAGVRLALRRIRSGHCHRQSGGLRADLAILRGEALRWDDGILEVRSCTCPFILPSSDAAKGCTVAVPWSTGRLEGNQGNTQFSRKTRHWATGMGIAPPHSCPASACQGQRGAHLGIQGDEACLYIAAAGPEEARQQVLDD